MLALLIERIAELECNKPWHQIKRVLDDLQITKLFNLNYRVLMRNELSPKTHIMLKLLKIKPSKDSCSYKPQTQVSLYLHIR